MNNFLVKCGALLTLVVLLTGCGSSPRSNHYVLTAKPGGEPSRESPSLGIGPIEIPEYLNRNALVYSREGNRVSVSATERWAEPLENGLQRVISLNLAVLLDTQHVRFFPWSSQRPPDYGVKINLLALDANDQKASLVAEWLVYRPASGETVKRRIAKIQQPLPAGELLPGQVAPAYSDLLYQLSQVIGEAIADDQADRGN